jgi:hypothetical protein
MGSLLMINPVVSMLLVCIPIIFVVVLLKSSWFKARAGVREAKDGLDRSEQCMGFTQLPRWEETADSSWKDGLGQNDDTPPAFTDSWEKGLGQNDDSPSAFTDRAF